MKLLKEGTLIHQFSTDIFAHGLTSVKSCPHRTIEDAEVEVIYKRLKMYLHLVPYAYKKVKIDIHTCKIDVKTEFSKSYK